MNVRLTSLGLGLALFLCSCGPSAKTEAPPRAQSPLIPILTEFSVAIERGLTLSQLSEYEVKLFTKIKEAGPFLRQEEQAVITSLSDSISFTKYLWSLPVLWMATPSDFQLLNRYSGLREFAQQFESSQEMIEAIESQVENDPRMIQMRASMQRLRESNRQVQAMQDGPPAELERLKRFSRVLTQDNPEERGLTEVLLQGVRRQGISRSRCVTFMLGEISRDLQKLQTLVSR